MAANSNNIAVVMVPFPEYGHLTPLLHLSRLISSYDIPVHYVSVGARNQELKLRLQGWNLDQFPNIQFHDIGNFEEDENNLSYAAFFDMLGEPLSEICRAISITCKRVVIIHDSLVLQVVQGVNSIPNVETYIFHAISAFTVYSLIHQISADNNNNNNNNNNNLTNDLFLPLQAHIPSIQSCYPQEMLEYMKILRDWTFKSGEILNTCRDIEGPYLDALAKQSEKPVWGLGPFNPVHVHNDEYSASHRILSHRCIEWLYKQPKNSVIYVSFGTASTFSHEQIIELALGLERSEQKFIWVLREADKKGNDFTTDIPKIELPKGFEERVAERGIIARDFVPQMEILAHPSTGGYLFHSGWNSFLESLTVGVPMATWPIHSDNPFNDVLITKVLKVGLVVKDWEHRDELVKANTIENGVRTLMTSIEGEEMRQRAIELSQAIKMSVKDGGGTKKQMESFIAHITR